MTIKIIIADDHRLFRQSISFLLKSFDFDIIAEVEDASSLFTQLAEQTADVLILDVKMPGSDPIKTITRIQQQWPAMHIIVVTGTATPIILQSIIDLSVDGLILKEGSIEELIKAIEQINQPGTYLSPEVRPYLEQLDIKLTPREKDVLALILQGVQRSQIAERLHLSVETVTSHRKNMMMKFGVNKAEDLISRAREIGFAEKQ